MFGRHHKKKYGGVAGPGHPTVDALWRRRGQLSDDDLAAQIGITSSQLKVFLCGTNPAGDPTWTKITNWLKTPTSASIT
jgi:hypothetical protein